MTNDELRDTIFVSPNPSPLYTKVDKLFKDMIEAEDHDLILPYDELNMAMLDTWHVRAKQITYSEQCKLSDTYRTPYRRAYGYVLLTDKFVTTLAEYIGNRPTVDLGAGSGYLAHQLHKNGVTIDAVDDGQWHISWNKFNPNIIIAKMQDYDLSPYKVIIMAWPNYEHESDHLVLANLTKDQTLIYIGEGQGGCTGSDTFHEILHDEFDYLEADSELVNTHIVQFMGIHDKVYVYRRKV